MSSQCFNMTWNDDARQTGRIYLIVVIPALLFHTLFWIQVGTHRILRQMSMFWVYNYLFTDFLLLIQYTLEYILRTTLPICISSLSFNIFCNMEAYTSAYMTVLEAYMLVGLNITRYYLIVKNSNICVKYRYLFILLDIFLYIFGFCILIFQVEVFRIVKLHPHRYTGNCHFQYTELQTQILNLIIVLLIPIMLNFYFMSVTILYVRRTQQAARSQRSKHIHLIVQFFVVYVLWLILWAPNVVVSHMLTSFYPTKYTRFGSMMSALCDPLVFMLIDQRFVKVWRNTWKSIINRNRVPRQIHPTSISHETI